MSAMVVPAPAQPWDTIQPLMIECLECDIEWGGHAQGLWPCSNRWRTAGPWESVMGPIFEEDSLIDRKGVAKNLLQKLSCRIFL